MAMATADMAWNNHIWSTLSSTGHLSARVPGKMKGIQKRVTKVVREGSEIYEERFKRGNIDRPNDDWVENVRHGSSL